MRLFRDLPSTLKRVVVAGLLCVCWCGAFSAGGHGSRSISSGVQVPAELEARLRAVYQTEELNAKRFGPVRWLEDNSGYLVLEPSASREGRDLVQYEPASGRREVLVLASQLIPAGTEKPLTIEGYAVSRERDHLLILTNSHREPDGSEVADYWFLDRPSGGLRKLAEGVEGPGPTESLSPDGQRIVFVRAHNLYVQDLRNDRITTLTTDGVPGSVGNGVNDWGNDIARWSLGGQQIAYVQADSRAVGQFPLINNTDAVYPKPRYIRFPKGGTPIPTLRVGVVNAGGGSTHWLEIPGAPGSFYIEKLDWAGDSHELLCQKLARSHAQRELFLADVRSNAVTRIYHEEDPAWVNFQATFFAWIRGEQGFVWVSEKDGWRHAYAVSRDGTKETLLTPDPSDIISIEKIDEKGGWLYYMASPENATQSYLYRVRLEGGGHAERVSPVNQRGIHGYQFSPDVRWAIHRYSTFDTPPLAELVELPEHHIVRVLEDNEGLREKMKSWITRPTEFFKIDIGGGVVMDAWMIKPRDFDPAKKYPVLVFVYGEPADQTVVDSWYGGQGHSLFHRTIADAGYLVLSMDNRGTPAPKGAAWRRAVFGSLGPLSTEEQAAGLRELARTRPYVDLSRVGIWGWSAGGTNTLNALFRKPDQYQVGIAVAPKPKPDLYNAWFQETFMRTPEVNPDGYRRAAALNYAEGLKGHLLIVQGTGDDNSHLQITELLVNRLIELGKPFDYMTYPNRTHGIREGPGTSFHLYMLIARYLIEHLPAGPR